jgi:hypothetical protein
VGCTSAQLRRNTLQQVGSLTNLQHQLVLNNLAAFACNPEAIPSQANVRAGATQVVDAGTGQVQYLAGMAGLLGLSRSHVDQWITAPVTDEVTLRLLRIAYRRSLGYAEDLYTDDFANRFAHRIKVQIVGLSDTALENAHLFARGPALPQILDRPGWTGDSQIGFPGNDPAVQRWQKDTTDIITTRSDRIVQRGEYLTPQTLVVAPALTDGQPTLGPDDEGTRVVVASPYAAEVRRQVLATNDCLLEIHPGWLSRGSKKDVPKCVCYVGHHRECGCDCYVWVLPQYRRDFEEFTLRILRLSSLVLDPFAGQNVGGVIYSPPVVR